MFYYSALGLILLGRTIFEPIDFKKTGLVDNLQQPYLVLERQYGELLLVIEKKTAKVEEREMEKPLTINKQSLATPKDIETLFEKYSQEYSLDKELLKKIAQCESGFKPQAINGPYAGMYQYLATTWASQRKAMGLNTDEQLRFDAEEAIKTAAFQIRRQGSGPWPVCRL